MKILHVFAFVHLGFFREQFYFFNNLYLTYFLLTLLAKTYYIIL